MYQRRTLRVQRVDGEQPDCLVNVYTASDKDHLDLKLDGTEGENAFTAQLKPSQISQLKAKAYNGSDDEWKAILIATLLPSGAANQGPDNVQLMASVSQGASTLELVWKQKKKSSATVIGSFALKFTEDEFEVVESLSITAEAAQRAEAESLSLRNQLQTATDKADTLEKQLRELVDAKLANETALLSKFALLLNEKKAKIRDFERDHASRHSLPRAESVEAETQSKAPPRRSAKRKAEAVPSRAKLVDDDESDDSSDAFEDDERKTPERDGSAEEASKREPTPPPPPKPTIRRGIGGKKQATGALKPAADKGDVAPSQHSTTKVEVQKKKNASPTTEAFAASADDLPPPRALPFARKGGRAPPSNDNDDDTDDEL